MPFFATPYNPKAGLYIGTSITQGNVTAGYEYVTLVNTYLRTHQPLYSYTALTNAGQGGSTSFYGLARVENTFAAYAPNVVSLDYGINDLETDFYACTAEALIRRMRTLIPGAMIVFLAFPRVTSHLVNDATNLNAGLHARWSALCAAYGVVFVDYAAYLKSVIDGGATLSDYMGDTVHPTIAGHALAAAYFEQTLQAAYSASAMPTLPERTYDCEDFETTPVWRKGTDNDGETGTWATSGNARTSSIANSTITWNWRGVAMGYVKLVTSTGSVGIAVDGGAETVHDLSVRNIANDLPTIYASGAHTTVFRVISGTVAVEKFISI